MADPHMKAALEEAFPAAWQHGDLSKLVALLDPDVVDHFDKSQGIEAVKGVIVMFRTAFPDLKFELVERMADPDKDKYVHQWTMEGTQHGELMGIPPTGRHAAWTGITILRVENGKIVERWANVDVLGILQQLGVVPPPGPPPGG